MLKNEWKAIFKHKFFIVVIIALALIPALYNYVFLGSMWDPYGKLNELPVAVVNLDKSSELEGKKIEIGDSIVSQMKQSKDLDYHFVSEKEASDGIKSGKYYMKITFPKNLSSQAASLMTDNPKSVQVDYQTTSGHNYISSKMSESAMNKLKSEVSGDITETYTKAIFDSLSTLKTGMNEAADGSSKLATGASQAKNGSQTLSSNLDTLAKSSLTFSDGASSLNVGLNQYLSGVESASTGANQLATGTKTYVSGVQQAAAGTKTLNESSSELTGGISSLQEGLSKMASETEMSDADKASLASLQSGLTKLNDSIQAGATNSASAQAVTADLKNVEDILTNKLVQNQAAAIMKTQAYQSLSAEGKAEIMTAMQTSAQNDLAAVSTSLKDVESQLQAMNAQTQALAQASNQALPAANQTLTKLSNGLLTVNTALNSQVMPGLSQLQTGANAYTAGVSQVNTGLQTLSQNSTQLTTGSSQLATGLATLTANQTALADGGSQLETGASKIASGSQQLASGSNSLTTGLNQVSTGTSQLASSLQTADNSLKKTNSKTSNATAIAKPVTLKHTDADKVEKNGVGMAPYMICVALFVGALSSNVVIGTGFSGKSWKTGREFMLAKIGTNGVVALLQALIVYGAVVLLGLVPKYPLKTLFAVILISFTFMAIVTFFVTLLGKVGDFLMIILLVLQLATSAGTYPIELTDKIYQVISPLLPMTYGLKMLRQTIGLDGNITLLAVGFIIVIAIFTGLLSFFKRMPRLA